MRRVRQPFRQTRINWSNPVTSGLISAASPFGFDSVRGKGTRYNSVAPSFAQSKFGTGVNLGQNQLDFSVTSYENTNQTHLVVAEKQTSGVWNVCAANHGMVVRLFNSLITFCSTNRANVFSSTKWSGVGAIIHTIDSDEHLGQNVYINGELVSWESSDNTGAGASGANGNINTIGGSYAGDRSSATWWDKPVLLSARWNRLLTLSEIKSVSENPWQIFEPETIPLFFSTVTAQYARPTSDVSAGGWTASTGTDLFAMLDETSANDSDYITTTTASTCEVALGGLSDPALSTGHIVRYRISATDGGIIVRLREGSTTIASWTHNPAPASLTTYAQTLTGGEADSITNYAALKLQFEAIA